MYFLGTLCNEEQTSKKRMRSRPVIPLSKRNNKGVLSLAIQTRDSKSITRVSIAKNNPNIRPNCLFSLGSRPTNIVSMIILSMPKTISIEVSVTSAIQEFGSDIQVIIVPLAFEINTNVNRKTLLSIVYSLEGIYSL